MIEFALASAIASQAQGSKQAMQAGRSNDRPSLLPSLAQIHARRGTTSGKPLQCERITIAASTISVKTPTPMDSLTDRSCLRAIKRAIIEHARARLANCKETGRASRIVSEK